MLSRLSNNGHASGMVSHAASRLARAQRAAAVLVGGAVRALHTHPVGLDGGAERRVCGVDHIPAYAARRGAAR